MPRARKFRPKRRTLKRSFKRRRGRYPRRSPFSGALSLARCANICNASNAGFIVDGTIAQKQNDFLIIAPGSTQNAVYFGTGVYSFVLSDLPSVTEFSSLFDRYKVHKVSMYILSMASHVPSGPPGAVSAYTASPSTFLHYVLDNDDATPYIASEAGLDAMRQVKGYRCKRMIAGKPLVIRLRPKYLSEVYRSAISTTYSSRASPWLSTAAGGVDAPGFGVKFLMECLGTGALAIQTFKVWVKAYISLKDPK